ncbi:WXG100 family type VII secretion target [Sphaerisporangium sp. TRM90804]|uniref:WXG100 family type VII secretion target n=1 Tax=Sphaerisporangium sp. TRM90804 TaxID=3031113 RepID=UPI002447C50A|nr:WXG100 family type VII secretion target [Sphaerisporangium sp. TRM90804]MDH2425093.1 WXG100 family type VII secretion target [Sphaerisporangium sp. TRM90804]
MGRINEIQAIRAGTAAPHGDPSTYGGVESVRRKLQNTDPDGVTQAGEAYLQAAGKLESTLFLLESVAGTLNGYWKDKSAQQVQGALQLLHGSARELAYRAREVGAAHKDYADELRTARENLPDSGVFTFDDDFAAYSKGAIAMVADGGTPFSSQSDNDKARQHLENLNNRIVAVYRTLPDTVTTVLPAPGPVTTPPVLPVDYPANPYGTGPGGGGYGTGGMPGYSGGSAGSGGYGGSNAAFPGGTYPGGTGGGSGGDGTGLPGGGLPGGTGGGDGTGPGGVGDGTGGTGPGGGTGLPGNGLPGGGNGAGTVPPGGLDPNDPRQTDLAGVNPPGPNGTGLPPGGLTTPTGLNGVPTTSLNTPPGLNGPLGSGPLGSGPLGTGPLGTGPLGTGPLGSGGPLGAGGASYGGAGAAGAAGQALGARGGLGGAPMGGMPFMPMGGAGGEANQERERSTWLTEDESVWGGDDPVAPAVIC